jgi:hypothetical protein
MTYRKKLDLNFCYILTLEFSSSSLFLDSCAYYPFYESIYFFSFLSLSISFHACFTSSLVRRVTLSLMRSPTCINTAPYFPLSFSVLTAVVISISLYLCFDSSLIGLKCFSDDDELLFFNIMLLMFLFILLFYS